METWTLGVPFKMELSPSAEDKGKTRSVFRLHNRDNGVGAVHQKSPLPGQREPGRALTAPGRREERTLVEWRDQLETR